MNDNANVDVIRHETYGLFLWPCYLCYIQEVHLISAVIVLSRTRAYLASFLRHKAAPLPHPARAVSSGRTAISG